MRLGVNIDHVATIRQQRFTTYPDPVAAAQDAEQGGANLITVHLREDRRHIQDRDVERLRESISVPLNLEMAATEEMVKIARKIRPDIVCLVPERRQELTTEGGLDVESQVQSLSKVVSLLQDDGIPVSLFINADKKQIDAAREINAFAIELHTGTYAESSSYQRGEIASSSARNDGDGGLAPSPSLRRDKIPSLRGAPEGRDVAISPSKNSDLELHRLIDAAKYGASLGLHVHAGHGLDYQNVNPIVKIPHIEELNIGHSIIARAIFVGLEQAVRDMAAILRGTQ